MQEATSLVQATHQMAAFCFDTLISKLNKQQLPPHPQHFKHIVCPLFVTWLLQDQLRGCIGTFYPQPLSKILGKYALISALEDDRFEPIENDEVAKLKACVSLLVDFRKDRDSMDWQIGRHGIILHMNHRGRKYQATFLPQVALQEEWSKQQTLMNLLQKAGYNGEYNIVKEKIRITTYESSKVEMSYEEYVKMKGNVNVKREDNKDEKEKVDVKIKDN